MLTLDFAATGVLVAILIGVCIVDILEQRIPNFLNFALMAAGLVLPVLLKRHDFFWGLASVATGFAFLCAARWIYAQLRGRQGLGFGDVKFFAASGGWIGLQALPTMLLVATLTALVVALAISGRLTALDGRLPFGPFLSVGLLSTWQTGPLQF